MGKGKLKTNTGCFWRGLNSLHLYDTKGEALFKTSIITISWIGGVHLTKTPVEITREIAAMFYLFALALIMEYLIKLIVSKKIIPKILPLLLFIMNVLIVFWTSAVLLGRAFENISFECLNTLTLVSISLIWLDTIIMVLVEPSESERIENNLKNLNR